MGCVVYEQRALPGFECEIAVGIGEQTMFWGRFSGLTKSMGTKSIGLRVKEKLSVKN